MESARSTSSSLLGTDVRKGYVRLIPETGMSPVISGLPKIFLVLRLGLSLLRAACPGLWSFQRSRIIPVYLCMVG